MYRSMTRWTTTTVAAAALMALPLAASAQQTTPPAQPPQQQTQPPAQPQPMPPATQQHPTPDPTERTTPSPQTAPASATGQPAVTTHLSAARDTLSEITALPEAAKLEGEARTQVSQMISNFNELITTQTNWRSVYSRVDANLTALLGPETADAAAGVAGAVGTSGTTGTPTAAAPAPTGTQLDPAVRTKLMEFRKHLKEFEKAAGPASAAEPSSAAAHTEHPATATSPTGATATSPTGATATPPGATATSGMTPAPAATAADKTPADKTPADKTPAEQAGHSEADKHLDAISAILAKSKTGALTAAQGSQLKKHVTELRALLKQDQ